LKQLHAGHRPAQIARKARVADSTVRTQIINIRHKTDTDSIGDLLRVLNALPPVAPLLKRTRSALHFRDQGEMR
jgi:DNA-binding CsgD family transcriptional regulator